MTWRGFSVFGLLLIVLGLMMSAPAALAIGAGDMDAASAFGLSALIAIVAGGLLAIAQYGSSPASETVGEFTTLLAAFLIAPAVAAAPVALLSNQIRYEAAYFEMVSTFTTTGATVFDRPDELNPALHLWRGMTAWLGGLIALTMAFALLAPRNLGGFEVRGDRGRSGAVGRLKGQPEWAGGRGREASADRVGAAMRMILPLYCGLTFGLGLILAASGMGPLNAAITAMGTLSTSGVKMTGGSAFANGGEAAEIVVVVFLILSATRRTYGAAGQDGHRAGAPARSPCVGQRSTGAS